MYSVQSFFVHSACSFFFLQLEGDLFLLVLTDIVHLGNGPARGLLAPLGSGVISYQPSLPSPNKRTMAAHKRHFPSLKVFHPWILEGLKICFIEFQSEIFSQFVTNWWYFEGEKNLPLLRYLLLIQEKFEGVLAPPSSYNPPRITPFHCHHKQDRTPQRLIDLFIKR